MKNKLLIIYSLLFLLSASFSYAAKEKSNTRINKNQITIGGSIAVMDNKYPNINVSNTAVVVGSNGKITLGLDNYANSLDYLNTSTGTTNFDIKVGLNVVYVTTAGVTSYKTLELSINHQNTTSSPFTVDKNIAIFKDAHILTASISYVKKNGAAVLPSQLPSNLYLEAEIETERYYELNVADIPTLNHNYLTASNELEVYWNSVTGGEEYELEWTYVNSFSSSSTAYDYNPLSATPIPSSITNLAYAGLEFTFQENATRIRTSKNSFKIPLNYERGLIVYRIRAIGKDKSDINYETIGNWSIDQSNTIPVLTVASLGTNDFYEILVGHQEDKNWQYTATFAEDGKKKDIIGYFDGSLKSRQTVTKTNTENVAIFAETIYDQIGRATVQFLPAPSRDYTSKLDFYENFNVSKNVIISGINLPYGKNDLIPPVSAGSCPYSPGPVLTNTNNVLANGAGVYYSTKNDKKDNQEAYIPDAQEIPFSTTIYTPDNTGKIKYQSGVGPDHKIGSGHESKYLYGDADQEDLDKLFGSEAGYKERYKKNYVIDPNGQISVSYLNTEGKVVATALAGNSPGNVIEVGDFTPTVIDKTYLDHHSQNYTSVNGVENGALIFRYKLVPTIDDIYTFTYDLTIPQFNDICIPSFCYDCIYDLDITIMDECQNVIYNKTDPVGLPTGIRDYTCGAPIHYTSQTPSFSPPFNVSLLAGKEYFLTKTLRLNEPSMNDYLNHYIANSSSACVKDINFFKDKELLDMDQSGCGQTCAECVDKVAAYYPLHNDPDKADPTKPAYDPTYIYMSQHQKEIAIKKCNEPCDPISLCSVQFETMLTDVKPYGQYAQYDNAAGVFNASTHELSVFNPNNYLRINSLYGANHGGTSFPNANAGNPFGVNYDMTKQGFWKNPEFYNKYQHSFTLPTSVDFLNPAVGESNTNFFNPDGSVTKVRITQLSSGAYYPQIDINTSTWLKSDAQGLWTYAQNLTNLTDFINAYNANPYWAFSLVKNHPEFNYFLDCDRQGNPVLYTTAPIGYTSDDFDRDLRAESSIATASVSPHWTLNMDNTINDLVESDPYFKSSANTFPAVGPYFNLKALLSTRLQNYQGTGKTLKQVVAEMYYVNNMYYSGCANAVFGADNVTCLSNVGGTNVTYQISNDNLNKQWQSYREMYLSEKQKLIAEQSHYIANRTYSINGFMNNYYNGAIGNSNFSHIQSYTNYGFNIFPNYTGLIPPWHIYTTPFLWPDYTSGDHGSNGDDAFQPPFSTGHFDFGSPSSIYHSSKYSSKIKRFPDVQELYNAVGGGSSDPSELETAANNAIYFQTGQCAIFKKLETFLSVLAGNGSLFSFGNTIPLVTEPSFTQDLYNAILECHGFPMPINEWHQIGLKPSIFGGNLLLKFYDISNPSSHIPLNADILLTPSSIVNWNDIKMFSNINYNGTIVSGSGTQSAFGIKAILQPNPNVAYTNVLFNGTTCIQNNCVPPAAEICKPTQQATELQNFLSAAMTDYNYSSQVTNTFNLGDPLNSSSQLFSGLVRYPFGNTPVTQSPISHSVTINPLAEQIQLQGQNIGASIDCPNGININFDFSVLAPSTGAILAGAVGFSNIKVDPLTPNQFTVTVLYNNPAPSKKAIVSFNYGGCSKCGDHPSSSCRIYKLSTCTEYIPQQCNTDGYNTAVQLENLLEELVTIDFSTTVPTSNLTSYTTLLASQIGTSTNNVSALYSSTYDGATNISTNIYTYLFQNTSVNPTVTNCSIVLKLDQSGQLSGPPPVNLNGYSFSEISILSPFSGVFGAVGTEPKYGTRFEFKGNASCLDMENCSACIGETIYKEDFEAYTNAAGVANSVPLGFETEYLIPPATTAVPGSQVYGCSPLALGTQEFNIFSTGNCSFQGLLDHTGSLVSSRNVLASYIGYYPFNSNVSKTLWQNKIVTPSNTATISTTVGKSYEISAFYNLYKGIDGKIELVVNDGVQDFILTSADLNIPSGIVGFSGWKNIKGTWLANSSNIQIKIRTTPRELTPGGNTSLNMELVFFDDVTVKERTCNQTPFYTLPSEPPNNDCADQLMNIALSNATQAYAYYINTVKENFKDSYRKKCYETLEILKGTSRTSEHHYTLYYYDQAGNLIKTVPPEGVEEIKLTDTPTGGSLTYGELIENDRANKTHTFFTTHRMATRYEYNSLNQLIRQHTPDNENLDLFYSSVNAGIPPSFLSQDMDFTNGTQGFMVGNIGADGKIYSTNDGGNTWTPTSAFGLGTITDIEITGTTAFAVTSDGLILKSINYSATNPSWQPIILPGNNTMSFTNIEFVGVTGVGYIIGKTGMCIYTLDAGLTWSNPISLDGVQYDLNNLDFKLDAPTNKWIGVVVGKTGTVIYSLDAEDPNSWVDKSYLAGQINVNDVEIIQTNNGTAVEINALITGELHAGVATSGVSYILNDIHNNTTTLSSLQLLNNNGSKFGAIASDYYLAGTTYTQDHYIAGLSAGVGPVLYKIHSVPASAPVITQIPLTGVTSTTQLNDIKITGSTANSNAVLFGCFDTGKLLKAVVTTNTALAPITLNVSPGVVNSSVLNRLVIDPNNVVTTSGLIVGDGTILKFDHNGSTTTSSSASNIILAPLKSIATAKDGSGRIYAVGDNGTIIYSNNNGALWQIYDNTIINSNLKSVEYVSATNGVWIVGDNGYVGVMDPLTNLITPKNTGVTETYYHVIKKPNNINQILLAGNDGSNSIIKQYNISPIPVGFTTDPYNNTGSPVNKIAFASNTDVFAVGNNGLVLKSTNAGNTFAAFATAPISAANFTDVSFTDQFRGYIFGDNNTLYLTNDGGITWVTKTLASGSNVTSVYNFGSGNVLTSGTGSPNLQKITDQSNDHSSRFFYDELGRLIISQNAKQYNKIPHAYSYTKYDGLGRITDVGEIAGATLADPATLTIVNHGIIPISSYNSWLLMGAKTEVTSTKYDAAVANTCGFVQDNLRKRVAATYLDSDDNLTNGYLYASYYSYDIHGNVKSLLQENPAMPTGHTCKKIDYQYDLISGKVNKVSYQKGELDAFYHEYSYDADNRLTNVNTSKDGIIWQQDAKYFYYLHGPLARTEFGHEKVQGMDYAYTLQGWIKGVNSAILDKSNDIGKDGVGTGASIQYDHNSLGVNGFVSYDAAAFALNYYTNDYVAGDGSKNTSALMFNSDITNNPFASNTANNLYNGNISSMVTAIKEGNSVSGLNTVPMLTAYKYDQLNRIKTMAAYKNIAGNMWQGTTSGLQYAQEFEYDANGNITTQKQRNELGALTEDLTYNYQTDVTGKKVANRLYSVDDVAPLIAGVLDQPQFVNGPVSGVGLGQVNQLNNYAYDELGNLKKDASEKIDNIDWTVYGKIKSITRSATAGSEKNMEFAYDASGNRVAKTSFANGAPPDEHVTTYYVRDAQGNVMATYDYKQVSTGPTAPRILTLQDHSLYGSSRLGMSTYHNDNDNLTASSSKYNTSTPVYTLNIESGRKQFELGNHLGNVITVVSDRKLPVEGTLGSGVVDHYEADIISATDYYPFGSPMPGRSYSSSANRYRYTFNGKESDVETVGTGGGTQDYGFRIYNPALGKFLSVDPLTSKYPFYTPYQFAGNSPICSIDVDGLEGFVATGANGHGMVISVEQANEINKRVTVSAFKVGFSEELPKKFVEHYAYGNSTLVTLNETEMAGLNVTHVGLGSGKIGQQVNPQIEGILPGESRKISFTADDGVAGTSGTLGQFTIHGEGTFTSDESGGWSFTGKMIFMDVWDFNKETPEEEKSRVEQTGRARSDNGKRQTEFAADHLPGKPFGVLSKVVDIKQTSKDKSFDWFNGKKEGGEGNRDTKVNSKYNDETN